MTFLCGSGSVPLINGSGSHFFLQWTLRMQKINFLIFFSFTVNYPQTHYLHSLKTNVDETARKSQKCILDMFRVLFGNHQRPGRLHFVKKKVKIVDLTNNFMWKGKDLSPEPDSYLALSLTNGSGSRRPDTKNFKSVFLVQEILGFWVLIFRWICDTNESGRIKKTRRQRITDEHHIHDTSLRIFLYPGLGGSSLFS